MSSGPETRGVCVLGRTRFDTGIGQHAAAALELFARVTNVSVYPTDRFVDNEDEKVYLPNGRPIPVTCDLKGFALYYFCDVPWNGDGDFNFTAVPKEGFRIVYAAFDSDVLPGEWVKIFNERFDLALFTSQAVETVARDSGVVIPVGTLPLALDLEGELARRVRRPIPGRTTFGTISAFHDRKNLESLIEAFVESFPPHEGVALVIHSNLAMGRTYDGIHRRVSALPEGYVTISNESLSEDEKFDLLDSFDVYVNVSAGEGYSIGPREALAQGKPLVLSDVPVHRDLGDLEGVFFVAESGRIPAVYPEINNRVFGSQALISVERIAAGLRQAHSYINEGNSQHAIQLRRQRAAQFTLTTLAADYQALIDPNALKPRFSDGSSFTRLPTLDPGTSSVALDKAHRKNRKKVIVQAHDGGFFSLFNIFFSTLVWSLQDPAPPIVLPDWDAARLLERSRTESLESYCYSTPQDGNMWLGLFEPLYGLSSEEMNDPDFLYANAIVPLTKQNEHKEPLLTYVNAFDLYQAPWFSRFRRQYNDALREHVRLLPEFQQQVDAFHGATADQYLISVHVKHPSHAIEQPNGRIAQLDEYLASVEQTLRAKGIGSESDDWGVFVATDQQRVIDAFSSEFGDRIVKFDDVTRIDAAIDAQFDTLPATEQLAVGHQLQHQLAADPSNWSIRFAWEVWRDAEAMAASQVLLHGVSNVSTAVSYFNPAVEMVYCSPDYS